MEEVNRKNVNRIKRMIIGTFLFFMIVPTVLCVFLFIRLAKLEKKVDRLMSERTVAMGTEGDAAETMLPDEPDAANVVTETNEKDKLTLGQTKDAENGGQDGKPADAASREGEDKSGNPEDDPNGEAKPDDANSDVNSAGVKKNGKTVYLTFDDGPSCYTEEILNILKEKNVKATFFVVLSDDTRAEDLKRIAEEGHTIGLHSMSHVYKNIYASLDTFKKDVKGVHDLVQNITGVDSHYYRFPGGSSNEVSKVPVDECIAWLDGAGYLYYDWNAMNGDATDVDYTPEQLRDNVLGYVYATDGDSMVLMHDLGAHYATVQALPDLIDTLLADGYTIAPIDDNTPTFHQHEISQKGE